MTNWKEIFGNAIVPEWLTDFDRDPFSAIQAALQGRYYFGHLNVADPSELLIDWALGIGKRSNFVDRLDEALAQWVRNTWGQAIRNSATATAVAWIRLAEIVANIDSLKEAPRILRQYFDERQNYLGPLSEGPSRDPLGKYLHAVARHQEDRSLESVWWNYCDLVARIPWYHGLYGIWGLRRLPPETEAEHGRFPRDVAIGLARLAVGLYRRSLDGSMSLDDAKTDFQRVAHLTLLAYPFPERWQEYWSDYISSNAVDVVPVKWMRELIPEQAKRAAIVGCEATIMSMDEEKLEPTELLQKEKAVYRKFASNRDVLKVSKVSSAPVFHDKLHTLDIALDPKRMRHTFALLAHKYLGETFEVSQIEIGVIRRRIHHCVLRYRVDALNTATRQKYEWQVIGNVYKAKLGERVFETMQQLWQNGFARGASDHISIPEPLYFSSPLYMLFHEEVPGLPVKTLLKQEKGEQFHFQQLARTIAKLHRCPMIPDAPFLVKDHLLRCSPRYQFLELACPELESRIEYIVQTAQKIEADLIHDIKLTPIHGNFHLGQVYLENDHAWLTNFDALGYGDPASDLGNVLVFLRGKIKKNSGVVKLIDVFLTEYFSNMDSDIAKRILLYEGLTNLRRACECLRLREEGWRRRIQRKVAIGVAYIEEMQSSGWSSERYLYSFDADDNSSEIEEKIEPSR